YGVSNFGDKMKRIRESAVRDYVCKIVTFTHSAIERAGRQFNGNQFNGNLHIFFEDSIDGLETGNKEIMTIYKSLKRIFYPKLKTHWDKTKDILYTVPKVVEEVRARFTSRFCGFCNTINNQSTRKVFGSQNSENELIKQVRGEFSGLVCSKCSRTLDADLNAALNITCLGYLSECSNLTPRERKLIPIIVEQEATNQNVKGTNEEISKPNSVKEGEKTSERFIANELIHQLLKNEFGTKIYDQINTIRLPQNLTHFEETENHPSETEYGASNLNQLG
ncbi:MAG: hypothetical protein NZO16_08075, partial [Deltaproteobacteria bacterium]|nr:hypothetical protein [Deltaproteobacteria bacterium]